MNYWRWISGVASVMLLLGMGLCAEQSVPPEGFTPLFNGKDLSGWKVPEGDNGHWKVKDGVIDCDARSESKQRDKSLWSEKSFRDFVLRVDWRLKTEPGFRWRVPLIGPDGEEKKGADGKAEMVEIEDADSGIHLRGSGRSQVNIWMWPIGSGEVYGYRTSRQMPAEVRARRLLADHRARAKRDGVVLGYTLADVRQLLAEHPLCEYCRLPVSLAVSLDHRTPIARGGKHTLDNLAVVCERCNRLEGMLAENEFRELLALLARPHPAARAELERRLLAGGSRYRRIEN